MPPSIARSILIVDDDPDLLRLLNLRLSSAGYSVNQAASGGEAWQAFNAFRPDLVISDIRMEGMDGHALFARLHAAAPSLPVILLTAHGNIPDAVAAIQRGVFGFMTKPFDGGELLARVRDALAVSPPVTPGESANWHGFVASASPTTRELLRQAKQAADSDTPVLLAGPVGAGKTTLACAIHAARASAGPLYVLDGEQIADAGGNPFSSIDWNNRATLLIRQIDRLPSRLQVALNFVLPEHDPLKRLLTSRPITNSRIKLIVASARPLAQLVEEGGFSGELYYKLANTVIEMPPLAERRDDIPLLVAHFLAGLSPPVRSFAPSAMALLCEADWPGNVRELRNVVSRAHQGAISAVVPYDTCRELLREANLDEMQALEEARREFERDYLVRLLNATCGNVSQAARIARRNRTEFYKLLARHALEPESFKGRISGI